MAEQHMLFRPSHADAVVACGSCTQCCKRTAVILVEGDHPKLWQEAEFHPTPHPFMNMDRTPLLKHQANGDCVFLGPAGCTVYDIRPRMCRVFSCVGWVTDLIAKFDRAERRRMIKTGEFDKEIFKAGRERMA